MSRTTNNHATNGRGRFSRRRFLAATGAPAGRPGNSHASFPPRPWARTGGRSQQPHRRGDDRLGAAVARPQPAGFMRAADAQVVALCDVDRWRLQMSKDNPAAVPSAKSNHFDLDTMKDCFRTTDFREVLARKDVDAVMITTPDHWHVPIALAAIKAGKDVACEKPIGLCIAHGRILADAAAKAKCVFRTDSEFRSIPHLVQGGKPGAHRQDRATQDHSVSGSRRMEYAAPHAADHAGPGGTGLRHVARPDAAGAVHGETSPRAEGRRRRLRAARMVWKSDLLRRRDLQLGLPSRWIASSGGTTRNAPVRWKSKATASFRRSTGFGT